MVLPKLAKMAPTEFMLLGADEESMKPLDNIQRSYGASYIGAGGNMLVEKPLLYDILQAALPYGLRLHGSGWENVATLYPSHKGFLPRNEIASAYSSSHVAIAVTMEGQDKAGMINNRIFEALSWEVSLSHHAQ